MHKNRTDYLYYNKEEHRKFFLILRRNLELYLIKENTMLGWALTFLVIALIAGALGFGGIAATAAGIAKVLFFIFLVIFVILLIMALLSNRGPPVV
jgi:uncharacterized membrane protein YtjA (UPF0391 family)